MATDVLADRGVRATRGTVLNRRRLAAEVDGLATRTLNYAEAEGPETPDDPHWHVDAGYALLGTEPPGDPVPDGPWERAVPIVRDYEFTDHRLLRGVYRADAALLGRDMLLQVRFLAMRFYLGVRVTEAFDENRDGHRVWGWTYETLQGHMEQGKLTYEVDKDLASGDVRFWIRAYSRRGVVPNPVLRLGFAVFGRDVQLDFYRRAGQRMRELVGRAARTWPDEQDGLVITPRARHPRWWDAITLDIVNPGC